MKEGMTMDAVKFLKEIRRMCKSIGCCDCPLNEGQGNCQVSYYAQTIANAVNAVEQWSSEHPAKTRLQDFLEKYPKAHLCKNGFPPFRPAALGYCGESICSNCKILDVDCWNMPLEE